MPDYQPMPCMRSISAKVRNDAQAPSSHVQLTNMQAVVLPLKCFVLRRRMTAPAVLRYNVNLLRGRRADEALFTCWAMSCPTSRDDVRARTLAAARALVHGHDRLQPSKLHSAEIMLPSPTDRIGSDLHRSPHAHLQQHAGRAPAPAPEAATAPAWPQSASQPAGCQATKVPVPASEHASAGQSQAVSPSSRSRAAAYGAAGSAGRPRPSQSHRAGRPPPSLPANSGDSAQTGQAGGPADQPPVRQSQGDGAWRKHHTVFTNAKAGMDKVDHDHVQRVVYEMSKARASGAHHPVGCKRCVRPCNRAHMACRGRSQLLSRCVRSFTAGRKAGFKTLVVEHRRIRRTSGMRRASRRPPSRRSPA